MTKQDTQHSYTRQRVLELKRKGLPVQLIAYDLKISASRVYQHIERLRELGELPPKDA